MADTNGSERQNGQVKNLHVELPEGFHKRLKMLCVIQGKTLKEYAQEALREKVERDDSSLVAAKKA